MSGQRFDPQQARAAVRRWLSDAPVQLADGFAHLVRNSPEERISQLMRTPARRAILDAIFWQMPQHLDRKRAAGINSTIRWSITGRPDGGEDAYQLEIADGRCRATRGPVDAEPRITITIDGAEFLKLATGNADPMRSYFTGRLAVAGDLMLAAKLISLFRIPRASSGPESRAP